MRYGITGARSTIAKAFVELLPPGSEVQTGKAHELAPDRDCYLFCGGYLAGRPISAQPEAQRGAAWAVNFADPVAAIERILVQNDRARICVIGSDSGIKGSYDMAYAGAKAALHLYVERRPLRTPHQQLVCIAPGIIEDSAMTERRTDLSGLEERRKAHPKGRFLKAWEVAGLAAFLLSDAGAYISGTTIRMNGGEHACR